MNEYRIVVDAGHGGSDPGAVSGNLKEKDFNLKTANYMYKRFNELGIPVIITRDTDEELTRAERINLMQSLGTDANVIVLSNHINAGGGEGAEVVYPLRTSSVLPMAILDAIGTKGQIKRKIYQRVLPENPSKDYYYIMRDTPDNTTLLIEYGFIDNAKDQVKLEKDLLNYAEGVVKAVTEYIGKPYTVNAEEIVNGENYTVQKGDTLYTIALKYNTTVDKIKELNNLTSNLLSIGQELKIPSTIIEEEYRTYTVQNGDTLYAISEKYGIDVNDLIDYNKLESTVLSVNQVLKIPTKEVIEEKPKNIYVVKLGDTLYSIAETNNTTVKEIMALNNLTSNTLSIGQELTIPKEVIEEIDYVVYKVEPGDTLYSIAKKYNSKVSSIKSYNNLTSDILSIGQVLQIPISPKETEYQSYLVERGDTLYSIASKYNTTVDAIRELNSLTTNLLQIGQNLKIPA